MMKFSLNYDDIFYYFRRFTKKVKYFVTFSFKYFVTPFSYLNLSVSIEMVMEKTKQIASSVVGAIRFIPFDRSSAASYGCQVSLQHSIR